MDVAAGDMMPVIRSAMNGIVLLLGCRTTCHIFHMKKNYWTLFNHFVGMKDPQNGPLDRM